MSKSRMTSIIRWTACLAVVCALILGIINRDYEPATGLEGGAITPYELLKRQPLNRRVFSKMLRGHISAYRNNQSDQDLLKQIFAVSEVLHDRDARNETARLYSALADFQAGREGDFLDSVKPVFVTEDYKTQLMYSQMIAQQVHNEDFFQALKSELVNRPAWGPLVLKSIMKTTTRHPQDLMDVIRIYPNLRGNYINYIRQKYSTAQAYDAFVELLDDSDLPVTIPYNPTIKSLETPAPFNWNMNARIAESLPRNGILATKLLGKSEYVLSQIIPPLDIGNYDLRIKMSGSSLPHDAYWQWVMSCQGDNKTVLNSKITKTSMRPQEYNFPFSVISEQCGFLHIVFNAVPGSDKRSFEAEVTEVNIVKK